MARKLLRQTVAITTGLLLMAAMFFGLGLWRRSGDAKWCRDAAVGLVDTGASPLSGDLVEQVRSICTVQRQRQRTMFGAVWRNGGQESAECGFEVARLQVISDRDPEARSAILESFGFAGSDFDSGSREDQNRFVQACLANGRHEAG